MILVVSKTKPTKLISALRASHVHTTLVLLNLHFALGTDLSVELNPNLSVVIAHLNSVVPFGQKEAINRSVSLLQAFEAPVKSTLANNVCLPHRRVVNSICTARSRAPFSRFVQVNERLGEVVLVALVSFLIAELLEESLWHNQFAATLRAGCVYRVRSLLDLVH